MKLGDLGELVILTLREPAASVRVLRGLDLGTAERWMVLVLAVCLSTLLAGVAQLLFPLAPNDPISAILTHPVNLAIIQAVALVVSAAVITVIGRAFGGTGRFDDALLLIAWVELILIGLQAMQIVLMAIFPGTGTLMSLVAFGLSIYLTISLTKALHGFTSTPKVAIGFIGGVFVLGFILSVIAAAFGILPEVTP